MTITAALELLLALLARSSEISALIAKANGEGRETFTPDEWATIIAADDAARERLAALIAAARAQPPVSP